MIWESVYSLLLLVTQLLSMSGCQVILSDWQSLMSYLQIFFKSFVSYCQVIRQLFSSHPSVIVESFVSYFQVIRLLLSSYPSVIFKSSVIYCQVIRQLFSSHPSVIFKSSNGMLLKGVCTQRLATTFAELSTTCGILKTIGQISILSKYCYL